MFAFRFFGALASSAAILVSIGATPVAARIIASSSSSVPVNWKDITRANYGPRKVYLPGKWTVSGDGTGTGSITFKKDGTSVLLHVIPKEECALSPIRIAATKLWGGTSLNQSQAQLRLLVLGRSTYRGYSWILPEKDYRWCLHEDRRYATEVVVKRPDKTLLDFLQTNFVRQIAVRSAIR